VVIRGGLGLFGSLVLLLVGPLAGLAALGGFDALVGDLDGRLLLFRLGDNEDVLTFLAADLLAREVNGGLDLLLALGAGGRDGVGHVGVRSRVRDGPSV